MYKCPSCQARTIGLVSKWAARETSPARCRSCSELSFVSAVRSSGIFVTSVLLITTVGFLAVGTHSAFLFAAGSVGVFGFYAARWHAVPLEPIPHSHVIPGAKAGALATLFVVLQSMSQ